MAPATHVPWNATVRSELQSRVEWAEAAAYEEAARRDSSSRARDVTPRPLLRARMRSPSPRYESSSRDDSLRSPAGWSGRVVSWAALQPPAAPVKPAYFSRSPSPPLRSRSPAPRYQLRPRSPAAPTTWGGSNEQLHIAANPYHQVQRAAPLRELPMLRHGRVARFAAKQRYGFIVDSSNPLGPDLFVNNASLALGCREVDTLRAGAYVTFRSDSRLVNGTMKLYAYDVAPADACAMRRGDGLEMRGSNAQQQRCLPENALPHVRSGGRPCAPRR